MTELDAMYFFFLFPPLGRPSNRSITFINFCEKRGIDPFPSFHYYNIRQFILSKGYLLAVL